MRRNYISPEYEPTPVKGTYNMIEESTYFSSKMLKIAEKIYIDDIDILWHENNNGEQLDEQIESSLDPLLYSTSLDKKANSKLTKDVTLLGGLSRAYPLWYLDINVEEILINYLFAILKTNRTFGDVQNSYTIQNDVNIAIRSYIKSNILDRYELSKIDFFIKERSIGESNQYLYTNNWDSNLTKDFIIKQYGQEYINDTTLRLKYSQTKGDKFVFDYYYNLEFTRI